MADSPADDSDAILFSLLNAGVFFLLSSLATLGGVQIYGAKAVKPN